MNDVTGTIIGAAIQVHRALGPGLMGSAYETSLCHELSLRGVSFERQIILPAEYKGVRLDNSYRIDLLVDSTVVVEIKAISEIDRLHQAQLLTYMKLGGWRLGLLINFNVVVLRAGIRRLIL